MQLFIALLIYVSKNMQYTLFIILKGCVIKTNFHFYKFRRIISEIWHLKIQLL